MRGLRCIAALSSVIGQASAEAVEIEIVNDTPAEFIEPPRYDQPVGPDMTARQERQMNKTRRKKKKAFRP